VSAKPRGNHPWAKPWEAYQFVVDEMYAGASQCRISNRLFNGEIFPCPNMMYDPAMKMGEIIQKKPKTQ